MWICSPIFLQILEFHSPPPPHRSSHSTRSSFFLVIYGEKTCSTRWPIVLLNSLPFFVRESAAWTVSELTRRNSSIKNSPRQERESSKHQNRKKEKKTHCIMNSWTCFCLLRVQTLPDSRSKCVWKVMKFLSTASRHPSSREIEEYNQREHAHIEWNIWIRVMSHWIKNNNHRYIQFFSLRIVDLLYFAAIKLAWHSTLSLSDHNASRSLRMKFQKKKIIKFNLSHIARELNLRSSNLSTSALSISSSSCECLKFNIYWLRYVDANYRMVCVWTREEERAEARVNGGEIEVQIHSKWKFSKNFRASTLLDLL